MNPEFYQRLEALQSKIHEKFMALYHNGEFKELEAEMVSLLEGEEKKALSITLGLNIYDDKRDTEMDFSHSGISYLGEAEPFVFESKPKAQRYIVNDQKLIMPKNICPVCWNEWSDKFEHPDCPYCEARLGHDISLILKQGACPKCGDGDVSQKHPICNVCNWDGRADWVRWE